MSSKNNPEVNHGPGGLSPQATNPIPTMGTGAGHKSMGEQIFENLKHIGGGGNDDFFKGLREQTEMKLHPEQKMQTPNTKNIKPPSDSLDVC